MPDYGHLPPQDLDAERCVLGACLLQSDAIDDVLPLVRPQDFYFSAHAKMFAAMLRMHEQGIRGIDAVTVSHELQNHGELEHVGGAPAFVRILETVPHAAHAVFYAQIVREMADRRTAIEIAEGIVRDCYSGGTLSEDIITAAEPELHQLLESRHRGDVVAIADALLELTQERSADAKQRIPTGWSDLDWLLNGGLAPGWLCVVAARPSIGKTALAANMAVHVASKGHGVVLFSLEQSRIELTERMLSAHSRVALSRITADTLSSHERERTIDASNALACYPIAIRDAGNQTTGSIAAKLRPLVRSGKAAMAIVDYLQLITPDDRKVQREQQVAAMSRTIKCVARDLSIPVILLAQLNRQLEARDNKRPRLSDLRESGAIEQDADVVLFLHRDHVFDSSAPEHEAELIVAKNRHGRTGDVALHWSPEIVTFRSAANPQHYEDSGRMQ